MSMAQLQNDCQALASSGLVLICYWTTYPVLLKQGRNKIHLLAYYDPILFCIMVHTYFGTHDVINLMHVETNNCKNDNCNLSLNI